METYSLIFNEYESISHIHLHITFYNFCSQILYIQLVIKKWRQQTSKNVVNWWIYILRNEVIFFVLFCFSLQGIGSIYFSRLEVYFFSNVLWQTLNFSLEQWEFFSLNWYCLPHIYSNVIHSMAWSNGKWQELNWHNNNFFTEKNS